MPTRMVRGIPSGVVHAAEESVASGLVAAGMAEYVDDTETDAPARKTRTKRAGASKHDAG